MGYWDTNEQGHSFEKSEGGEELLWGDQPADIIDNAIWEIKVAFLRDIGRLPSVTEILSGIKFSTNVLDGLPAVPSEAKEMTAQQEEVIRQHGYAADGGDTGLTERRIEAQRHVNAVIVALAPAPITVPDNLADLIEDEKPF